MTKIKDLRSITPRTNGTRSVSAIKNIARHHSATTSGSWNSFWPHWNKVNGWGTGGYHEIILRDGTVELCYDPHEITNGVGGQNSYIYNICLVGNGSFTAEQERVFDERVHYWLKRFNLPVSAVKGHKEFPGQSTSCPGVNMNTVRVRLNGQASTSSTPKEEQKLYKPSAKAITNSTATVLGRLEQKEDKPLDPVWRQKLLSGELTDSDAIGLLFVAIDRGHIVGK